MRLGADRDVDDVEARSARRRTHHADARDWYAAHDVASSAAPRRTRIEEVQRPVERPPAPGGSHRGGAGRGRSTRNLDASQSTMPPPPRPTRSSADAYRRPSQIIVQYENTDSDESDEDEDEDEDDVVPVPGGPGWRQSRQRARSPEYQRPPHRHPPVPPPVPVQDPDDDEEDEDSDEDEIEVVEEMNAKQFRRHEREERRQRHSSSGGRTGSSSSRRRHQKHRAPSPSSEDEEEEVEVRYRHSSPERRSPVRRPVLRREISDPPKNGLRISSIIEDSRPPVASRRVQKIYEKEIIQESRGRRRHSRSSSRRPPSILGSIFGGSSSRVGSPDRHTKYYKCLVCMEEVPANKCAKLKCGHRRCNSCLKRQFKLSITDPQEMPPKCCTSDHIPLRHVDRLFDISFKRQWNRKFAEYSTHNRIYCPSRRCGEWIRPSNISRDRVTGRKIARCDHCTTKVCVSCNGKWHGARDCPHDEETDRFLRQAQMEGWKRCYRCKAMVELKEGCNHMTCRCGAEFCMICGLKWKNCGCPWFNYDVRDDRLDMNIPMPTTRGGSVRDIYVDDPPSPVRTGPRPRPRNYEEEAHIRRLQEQRDEDMARRMQHTELGRYEDISGIRDEIAVGNTAGHFMNEHYQHRGRNGPPPPPAGPPPGMDRPTPGVKYVVGVNKARGRQGGSLERRLADRFSENRQAPGSMPGMGMDPPPPPALSPPHGPSPIRPPPMGMPPRAGLPPPPMGDMMYGGMRGPVPMAVEREQLEYEDDNSYKSRSSRGRRHHRRHHSQSPTSSSSTPKSSTLAGLSGRGVGMGRVDVWRKYVEPGDPEGELAAAAMPMVFA